MKKMLLMSSSSYQDTGYLRHCKNWVKEFLQENGVWDDEILFIPYAGVRRSNEEYEQKVQDRLKTQNIRSIHRYENLKDAITNAKSICVGGGNTFMLLHELYKFDLVEILRQRVASGVPYFGWSAGANIAGSTIMTTNDMPIVMPKSFNALNLFPHQINPHFISGKIAGHNGESREERLEEFLIANQQSTIYALPEGTALKINGENVQTMGMDEREILKFQYAKEVELIKIGDTFKI